VRVVFSPVLIRSEEERSNIDIRRFSTLLSAFYYYIFFRLFSLIGARTSQRNITTVHRLYPIVQSTIFPKFCITILSRYVEDRRRYDRNINNRLLQSNSCPFSFQNQTWVCNALTSYLSNLNLYIYYKRLPILVYIKILFVTFNLIANV